MNTEATSYQSKSPKKCLKTAEKVKKKNDLNAYLKQGRHCTPFVVSVDSLLGVKGEATLKRIAGRLTKKWKEP